MSTAELTIEPTLSKQSSQDYCQTARDVVNIEAQEIYALQQQINPTFTIACDLILQCQGRVIVTGMGKSGHIANKIASTLASTGTPAFFVHPGEASHGDLGMITHGDILLAISNSGETPELMNIIPLVKRLGATLISICGNGYSSLAKAATVNIDASVKREACPLGLAPTSSTTVALVLGDALAIALLKARKFTREDFALSHPGGTLGKRLLLKVKDLMITKEAVPKITPETTLENALMEISQKGLGSTAIVDDEDHLLGIFTDGDLRRALYRNIDLHNAKIGDIMSSKCKTIALDTLAAEAIHVMETYKITILMIVDEQNKLIGSIHLHDLLRAGIT